MSVRWTFSVARLTQLFLGTACVKTVGLPDMPALLGTTDAQSISEASGPRISPDLGDRQHTSRNPVRGYVGIRSARTP